MSARRRHHLVALAVVALAVPTACTSDDDSDASGDSATAATTATSAAGGATTVVPTPDTAASTGPLSGTPRVACGPVTAEQLEPMAAVLRSRLAGVDGAEVGTSTAAPDQLLVALPSSVSDADAAALCAPPRFDVRAILQELTDTTTAATDDVFPNEFGNRLFRLGPVIADGTTFNPGTIAQEIHGTGWLVATTLTADGTAQWSTALDACFGRTDACPTGQLAYLLEDRVVVTGPVAAPLGGSPTFGLPGTWSEETATRLAALIDVVASGAFGPVAG